MNNSPLIRFHGYSNSWKNLKLKEHSKLITKGTTPKSKTIKGDINFIKVENLRSGKIFVSSKISENDHFSFLKRSILHEGDILFSIAGTLGRAAIVRKSILPANTNQALAIIRGYNFNSTFLLTALSGKVVREYVQKNPTVGAQPNLSLEQVGNLIISSPLIEEQNEIGIFFEKIDNIISLNQQELDALKQTKQGFLQRMFPKDGETVPEVRLPSFSDEWVPWKLSDITDLITKGTTPKNMSNEGLINFVKVENINPFSNQITSYSKISLEEHNGNLKRSQLKKNDILFSIAGTLGRTAIVKEKDLPANTNQALAILRMKNTNIDFITTYLKGKLVKDYIRKNPTIGAQPNLSLQQLKDLHVFLPSNQEQIKIGTFFRQIDEVIELKEQELEALKQTKKGFLQKMFV